MSKVVSVSRSHAHVFSKPIVEVIEIVEGLGVEGDAHSGETVKHRSRVAKDPTQPNLRQVHLIHSELFAELHQQGFEVAAGDLGENITTHGIALLELPAGTHLRIGEKVRLEVTGLRNPCIQIDRFQKGLMKAVLGRDNNGGLIRKTGVMAIVVTGGEVRAGDRIDAELPPTPWRQLEVV